MFKDNIFWKIIAIALVFIIYLFALNGRYRFIGNNIVIDKWKARSIKHSIEWANTTYDKDKAKQLYNQVGSKIKSNEDQFYQKLSDAKYARKVYRTFADNEGINLLDAPDEDSFIDSLKYKKRF